MSRWQKEKELVLFTARELVTKGMVIGSSGNVSLRLGNAGEGLLAVTPTSLPYDTLSPDDIQLVDFSGRSVEGSLAPSMETNLHIGIYQARPDVNAVIHTHSVFASAAAVLGHDIPPILDEQVLFLGGSIRCARYGLSGSQELADAVLAALGDRSAALLRNHGAIGTGHDLPDAMTACELLEKTARIYLMVRSAGTVTTLPEDAVKHGADYYRNHRENRS